MSDSEKAPKSSGIQVNIDANFDIGSVFAVLEPADYQETLTAHVIHEKLELKGVDHWDIDESAVEDVLKKVQKGQQTRLKLGSKKDATVNISISDDKMQVIANISPAKGGVALSQKQLLDALAEKKVSQKRLLKSGIEAALNATQTVQIEVARGKYPERGKDSEFVQLVTSEVDQELAINDQDTIDFLAGKVYSNIAQGTALLQRTAAEPGKIGQDVFGHIIQPEGGIEIDFEASFEGASLSPDDPNIVIADIDGHPVFSAHGVKVDPTLHFNNIDLSTGHVEFKGSVEIKGDVCAGMKVIASGDIFIKGTVERAYIKSGANITIQGGIVGNIEAELATDSADSFDPNADDSDINEDDLQEGDNDAPPIHYECEVIATGDLTAKYANVSSLSGANIYIKEYIFNGSTQAKKNISLGQKGGKGKLVGGKSSAGHAIIAKVIGSEAYNKTNLKVGSSNEERLLHKKLLFLRQKRQEQVFNLKQLMHKIPADKIKVPDSNEAKKAEKINHALTELDHILSAINQRIAKLESLTDVESEPFVQSTNACYPNVFMSIFNAHVLTQKESRAAKFVRSGRKIVKKN